MYNFDNAPCRAGSDSVKWHVVQDGVLPMWVADMDLSAPPPVVEAIAARAAHPCYGYPYTDDPLKDVVAAHYEKTYGVKVPAEWIVWVPSVIPGVAAAMEMTGGTFMYSVPMYDHIRRLYAETGMPVIEVPMKRDENYRYTLDIPALEAALTPEVTMLLLCNPHNPVGRVFSKEELLELYAFCEKHGLLVISDEIHCEFALDVPHTPFFAVSEAAAQNSITVSSAGKICNIPGLPMGFAIIPNGELRAKFERQQDGLQACPNVITLAAYEKAYDGSCDVWKEELRDYLRINRDLCEETFGKFPELKFPHNEGTYLLWVDCSALGVEDPAAFFLEKARVRVNNGDMYGDSRFIRFNYGCTHAQVTEALARMEKALLEWKAGR